MCYLICTIEPLLEVLAYDIFLSTKDKRKNLLVFGLLFGAVLIKHFFGEKIYIPVFDS